MPRTTTTPWRSRITGSGTLKVAEAKPHELNFRLHPAGQSQALAASLDNVGWVQQVVVNTTTGNLLDGHLRVELAAQRGEAELPCLFVELSEDEERLVLASLDPIAAMATADRAKLQELLASIQSEDEAVRGLLESIARQEHIELPALRRPGRSRRGARAVPRSRSAGPAISGCWATTVCCAATARSPEDVQRLMAGERAVAHGHRPALPGRLRRRQPPADLGQQTAPTTKDKHWDDYIDHDARSAFYATSSGRPGRALCASDPSSTSASA